MREDWVECSIGEVAELNPKMLNKNNVDTDLEVQFLPMRLVEAVINKIHLTEIKTFGEIQKKSYTYFSDGDILFAKVTPCMENGKIAVASALKNGIGFGSSEFHVFRCSSILLNNYLFNFIVQERFRNNAQRQMTGAVGLRRVPKKYLFNHLIPLPPLPIQRAIVSKIETLFSDLDNGIADLKKAKDQLKIYRQAVLKKAFDGELTKVWREKQSNLPTAEELLFQINKKRKKWLESEIANGNNEAKRIKTKIKKSPYHISNSHLPNNWSWTTFLNSCLFVIDCHNKTAPYIDKGIYLVRTTNIRNGKLDLQNKIKFVSEETYKFWSKRAFPMAGDIIFTREAPMGEAVIIPDNTNICLGQRTMLLRVIDNLLSNKYLLYNILSDVFQQRFKGDEIGTGVKHLRVGDVEDLSFPLCSLQEQHQIVREIESRLSVCNKVEESIIIGLEKAKALRQSILKKAFEGKLLSETEIEKCKQEADYEPASVLLERIKKDKAHEKQN